LVGAAAGAGTLDADPRPGVEAVPHAAAEGKAGADPAGSRAARGGARRVADVDLPGRERGCGDARDAVGHDVAAAPGDRAADEARGAGAGGARDVRGRVRTRDPGRDGLADVRTLRGLRAR